MFIYRVGVFVETEQYDEKQGEAVSHSQCSADALLLAPQQCLATSLDV